MRKVGIRQDVEVLESYQKWSLGDKKLLKNINPGNEAVSQKHQFYYVRKESCIHNLGNPRKRM
jgi:hypothetical protein